MCPFLIQQLYTNPALAIENILQTGGPKPVFISLGEAVNGRMEIDKTTVTDIIKELPPPGSYMAFPIVATGFATRRIPKELHVSETLPHIRLPLGTASHGISLLVLYDTGGGLSIGRRSYHEQIRQLRLDLVTSYTDLTTDNSFDPLTIGGIDGEVYGPSVTAIISYRLPFVVNGQNCSITFGLAEHAVTSSLIGIPFMMLAGMVHSAKDRMVSSTVFASSYVCEHLQPVQTDAPRIVNGE
eukprot:scaffold421247_cov37-Attheya_sp.AAC.2